MANEVLLIAWRNSFISKYFAYTSGSLSVFGGSQSIRFYISVTAAVKLPDFFNYRNKVLLKIIAELLYLAILCISYDRANTQ